MSSQLPTLPEPKEQEAQQQPDIVVEREDDTPEEDRGREAPSQETYTSVDDEGQDAPYSAKVQGRLKQLRHVYHEERRQKEAAVREREALVGYAQSLQQEIEKLRGIVTSGERVLLDQAQQRAEAVITNAREAYRRAHDSGDAEEMVKAQEALARAVSDHERMKRLKPSLPPEQQPQSPAAAPAAPAPQQPQLTTQQQQWMQDGLRRYETWRQGHSWHKQPGYEDATEYLAMLHNQLESSGIYSGGPTADTYWSTVNQKLSRMFPNLSGSGQGAAPNGNGQPPNGREQTRPRPVTATSGNRTGSGPQKVRLKESQIRMAQRLGVTPEQYAREVLKLERNGQ